MSARPPVCFVTVCKGRLAHLREAIARLPEKQRAVLLLVKTEGLSLQETARMLGMKLNTVKTTLHRGRLRLAQLLAEGEKR